MSAEPVNVPIEELLAEREWLTRLARSLCGRADGADDLVQESYRVALERPPRRSGSVRGWLARVTTNLFRERLRRDRAETGRRQRAVCPAAPATADELAERLELQREISRLVLDLPRDSRTILLLRYWEDLTPAEIAARLDLPGGTVRSRLKRALDRLRADLDEGASGNRRDWTVVLLPLIDPRRAAAPAGAVTLAATGGFLMSMKAKLVAAAAILALAGGGIVVGIVDPESPPTPLPELATLPPLGNDEEQPPQRPAPDDESDAAPEPGAGAEVPDPAPVEVYVPDLQRRMSFKIDGTIADAMDVFSEELGVSVTATPELLDSNCTLTANDLSLENAFALLCMLAGAEWWVDGAGIVFGPKGSRPAPPPTPKAASGTGFQRPRLEQLRPLTPVPGADLIIHVDAEGALSVEYPPGAAPTSATTDHALWLRLRLVARNASSALVRADARAPAGSVFAAVEALCSPDVNIGQAGLAVSTPDGGKAVLELPILKGDPRAHIPNNPARLSVYPKGTNDSGSRDPADLDRWCAHIRKWRPDDLRWCVMDVAGGVSIEDVANLLHRIRSRGVAVTIEAGSDRARRGPAVFFCLGPMLGEVSKDEVPAGVVETAKLPPWAAAIAPSLCLKSGPPPPISGRQMRYGLTDHHGGKKTETVVKRCLSRLLAEQTPGGTFEAGPGRVRTTAAAALALLGRAAPGVGANGEAAKKALAWLASVRKTGGGFSEEEGDDPEIDDALAAWAFVEAAAWRPEEYRALARAALTAIEDRWRTGPARTMLSAIPLALAPIAGLTPDPRAMAALEKRLTEVGDGPEEILVRAWLGEHPGKSPAIISLVGSLDASLDDDRKVTALRSLALFQAGGSHWIGFNRKMWDGLLGDEELTLAQAAWTAIALQAYYRYRRVTSYFR